MTSTMEDFRIESHERGGGLQSIQPGIRNVADDLRETLRSMEALLRVARGEGSPADFERLEIEPDADPVDVVPRFANSWALDVEANGGRVYVLLSTGGPNVNLNILRSEAYGVEEVILSRSWFPAHDRAWTDDERALGIVADFLDLIGC